MADSRDKRRYPRIEVNAFVDCSGDEVLLFHKIENISLGGLSLKSSFAEDVGTICEIVVNFPDFEDSISCKGEVVWCRPDGEPRMGVKFVDISDFDKVKLSNYLTKEEEKTAGK